MDGSIFISYRRGDGPGFAGRIYDRLEREFGAPRLFFDIDNIPPGEDFVDVLQRHVDGCDVLLAIIGRGWIDARDPAGARRLDNPNDFVRIEVARALAAGKRVVPVLVDGADMPGAEALPDDLKPLARRNAVRVGHEGFRSDTERLTKALAAALDAAAAARRHVAPPPPAGAPGRVAEAAQASRGSKPQAPPPPSPPAAATGAEPDAAAASDVAAGPGAATRIGRRTALAGAIAVGAAGIVGWPALRDWLEGDTDPAAPPAEDQPPVPALGPALTLTGGPAPDARIHDVAFSGSNGLVAMIGEPRGLVVRGLDGRLVRSIEPSDPPFSLGRFSPDGSRFALIRPAGGFGTGPGAVAALTVEPLEDAMPLAVIASPAHVQDAFFSRDNRLLVAVPPTLTAEERVLAVYDVASGSPVFRLAGLETAVSWVDLAPDGGHLLLERGGAFEIWDVEAARQVATLPERTSAARFVSTAAVLAVVEQNSVREITIRGIEARRFPDFAATWVSLAISGDLRRFLSWSGDRVRMLDPVSGELLAEAETILPTFALAALSRDGKRFAAAMRDGTIRVHGADGTLLARLEGQASPSTFLWLDDAGSHVVSFAEDDRAVRVWSP